MLSCANKSEEPDDLWSSFLSKRDKKKIKRKRRQPTASADSTALTASDAAKDMTDEAAPTSAETTDPQDLVNRITGFEILLDVDEFDKFVHDSFRAGSDDSDCYWGLVGFQRFVRRPRVALIDRESRYLADRGWRIYSKHYLKCLEARKNVGDRRVSIDADSFSSDFSVLMARENAIVDGDEVNIGLAAAEVKLIIWDDNTMICKVELQSRWSIAGDRGIQSMEDELPCADRHPFVAVGTLIEGADPEVVGRDLLDRWLNPPPPKREGEEDEEESVEYVEVYKDVWCQKLKKKKAGKIYCMLLYDPVLLPGVIRPILGQPEECPALPQELPADEEPASAVQPPAHGQGCGTTRSWPLSWPFRCCGFRKSSPRSED